MDLQRMIERDYDVTFYTPPEPEPEMITPDAPQQNVSVGEFAQGIATTYADMAKGAAQGFVGMPGDIEGIVRLLLDRMGFDVTQDTILPKTDEAKAFLDKFIPTLSETASGMDRSAAEYMGEMIAPGGYSKAIKPIVKGAKNTGKPLAAVAATATMDKEQKAK